MFGFIFPVILVGFGYYLLRRHYKFFKNAIRVPGTITSYTSSVSTDSHGHRSTTYTPIVSFEFDGKQRTVSHPISGPSKPEIGTPVQVGVNPYNIEEARVYSKLWLGIEWGVLGIGLAGLALWIAFICGKL